MFRRPTAAVAAALLAAGCLASCAPTPTASPSPTATGVHFKNADEAYTAAKKTYEGYLEALNKIDLRDPAKFETVYNWETGDALDGDKKGFTGAWSDGLTMKSNGRILETSPMEYNANRNPRVVLRICLDVRESMIFDRSGKSTVSDDRPDVQTLAVSFDAKSTAPFNLLISGSKGTSPKCDV